MAMEQAVVRNPAGGREASLLDARKVQDLLFTIIVGSLYTYALSLSMLAATYIRIGTAALAVASVAAVVFFHLWFYNKYTFWGFTGLLAVAAAIAYFQLRQGDFQQDWWLSLLSFAGQLQSHVQGLIPYQPQFQVLGLGLAGLLALLATLNLRVRFHFFLLTLLGAGAFGLPYFMNYRISETGLVLFFLCFLLMLVRKQGLLGDRTIARRQPVFGLVMIPVCMAIMVAASLLPRPAPAQDRARVMDSLHSRFSAAEDFLYGLFNPKYFSFQSTGFTREGGLLGGRVRQNNRYVMDVYTDRPVYLRGSIKDTYTGYSWVKSQDGVLPMDYQSQGRYDLMDDTELIRVVQLAEELLSRDAAAFSAAMGLEAVTGEDGEDHLAQSVQLAARPLREMLAMRADPYGHSSVRIDTGTRRTQNIFTPSFAQTLSFGMPVAVSRDGMGDLYADALMPKGISYTYSYIPWNNAARFDMEGYQSTIHTFLGFLEAAGVDAGAPDSVLEPYLQVPEGLPQRVGELAALIVGEETNTYARLRLLESYLSRYPYTLSPVDVPPDADFVDFFLFEGMEGYCTYYASAFAIMARTLGIPTRYLEGYTLPAQVNSGGGYTVTNMEAHAWVEAWLPGIGWYPFEPTQPFTYSFYNNLLPGATPPSSYTGSGADPLYDMGEEFDEMLRNPSRPAGSTAPTVPEEPISGKTLWGAAGLLALALGLAAGLRLAWYRVRRRRLEALDNKNAVLRYFGLVLRAAQSMGHSIEPNETALAWADRVEGSLGIRRVRLVAETYSRAAYSPLEITLVDREKLKSCYLEMLRRLKTGRRRPVFIINHYFLQKY